MQDILITDGQLIGFCQTVWQAVIPRFHHKLKEGNEAVKAAVAVYKED